MSDKDEVEGKEEAQGAGGTRGLSQLWDEVLKAGEGAEERGGEVVEVVARLFLLYKSYSKKSNCPDHKAFAHKAYLMFLQRPITDALLGTLVCMTR